MRKSCQRVGKWEVGDRAYPCPSPPFDLSPNRATSHLTLPIRGILLNQGTAQS